MWRSGLIQVDRNDEVTKADERRIHRLRLHPAVATAEE
jgi:hypothetical protein